MLVNTASKLRFSQYLNNLVEQNPADCSAAAK